MAVYKVIQDIESEDRLLGPLTFKGLVYAMIVGLCGFINFKLAMTSALGPMKWIVILILLFPMLLFGILASPLGKEQPTEVWLLARIRFMLQSRKRIWNQSGMIDLVTITAPKKLEVALTKNFTQDEVKSRLSALANTLDSRGWAIKNVNISHPMDLQDSYDEERLLDTASVVQEVPEVNITAADDMLDEHNNPTAQNVQTMMKRAEVERRQALQTKMQRKPARKEEYLGVMPKKHSGAQGIHDLKPRPLVGFAANSRPVGARQNGAPKEVRDMTPREQAAKLELANSGNDLSVDSISKLANHNSSATNEVEVALH